MNQGSTELTTFIGIFVTSLIKQGYPPAEVKRMIIQSLVTEIINLCDDNNDESAYNDYALQHYYIGINYLLNKNIEKMMPEKDIPQVSKEIEKLKFITKYFDHKIEVAKNIK